MTDLTCSCGQLQESWWRDETTLRAVVGEHETLSAAARAHGPVTANTLSTYWNRFGLPKMPEGRRPKNSGRGDEQLGDDAIQLDVDSVSGIERALRARGMNPDEWIVVRVVVNDWEGFYKLKDGEPPHTKVPLKQLKVTLRPRIDLLLAPATDVRPIAKPKPPTRSKPRLIAFVGDEQAPYQDDDLLELFLRWLAHNQPDEGIHLGDLMDLPTLSRHRPNPIWNATPQQCINTGYRILRARREASPSTYWRMLGGNHEERIRDYLLQRAAEMFGVRPAQLDEQELDAIHSLPALLHLDALGIEFVGTDGDYEHEQIDISDELVARHGFITGQNSAAKTVDKLGLSVILGHTHRQVVSYVTEKRRREMLMMRGIEAGCMCRIEGGLGYVVNPSWQNGFYAANVWPDGSFSGEHATYKDGVLSWRDQRYEIKRRRAT